MYLLSEDGGVYFDKYADKFLIDGSMCYNVVGLDGRPVERTKQMYPYSYDPFLIWARNYHPEDKCVDSDRMMGWDLDKFARCCVRAFGDNSQMFYNREPHDIDAFLNYYLGKPVRLTAITEGCNFSSGYPIWSFYYSEDMKVKPTYIRNIVYRDGKMYVEYKEVKQHD